MSTKERRRTVGAGKSQRKERRNDEELVFATKQRVETVQREAANQCERIMRSSDRQKRREQGKENRTEKERDGEERATGR